MFDKAEIKKLLEKIIENSPAEETEVIFTGGMDAATRFSDGVITQNVELNNRSISVRVIDKGRTGRFMSNRINDEEIYKSAEKAMEIAAVQTPDAEILPLPTPQEYRTIDSFYRFTVEFPAAGRTELISQAVRKCRKNDLSAAGIFAAGGDAAALANSQGVFCFQQYSDVEFNISASGDDVSGWCAGFARDVDKLDTKSIVKTAIRKALDSQSPKSIEPGCYTVIFESAAAAEFLMFMGWEGFGAVNFLESKSFLSGKIGEKVLSENITIIDDAYHPLNLGLPFDFEGIPRKAVTIIENGVVKSVVWDRHTAKMGGTESTGHALPQPNPLGPLPLNLRMEGGDSSLREMIESTDKGILVTRLHYSNILNPVKLDMTGMTRDGTFMIEKGEIAYPIKNMRYTQGIVQALNRVEALSKEVEYHQAFFGGGMVTPAMKIAGFHFSSGTEF
ncbi:TldD/PmbA family protein [bacterium]|nr:TldD/PmbA family protein [bacterium]